MTVMLTKKSDESSQFYSYVYDEQEGGSIFVND